jgi:hypothetical protein
VVRRAVDAGYQPRSFLLAERWLNGLLDVIAAGDAPCYVVDDDVAEQVTGFHVHRGALASMQRRALPEPDAVLAEARRVLVLEDVVDHTNVGAVFRSAAALGIDAALLSPRCADPLYRRAVKVSMGAVFAPAVDPGRRLVRRGAPAVGARLHDRRAQPCRRQRGPGRGCPEPSGWRCSSARRVRASALAGNARPTCERASR